MRRRRRLAAALVTGVLAAGCGTGGVAVGSAVVLPPAVADAVTPTSFVMIIRHAEKPDGDTDGVDAHGNPDDSSLTPTGWDRAHRLADLFAPPQGPPRRGLARPAAVYAAGATGKGEGARTRETVQPLAARLGVETAVPHGKGEEEELVEDVLAHPGPTLVSWQHSGIPTIVRAFPGVAPEPPAEWPDDRFDVVWTLTRTADGWRFAQLPEELLPGDGTTVIEN